MPSALGTDLMDIKIPDDKAKEPTCSKDPYNLTYDGVVKVEKNLEPVNCRHAKVILKLSDEYFSAFVADTECILSISVISHLGVSVKVKTRHVLHLNNNGPGAIVTSLVTAKIGDGECSVGPVLLDLSDGPGSLDGELKLDDLPEGTARWMS